MKNLTTEDTEVHGGEEGEELRMRKELTQRRWVAEGAEGERRGRRTRN